MFLKDRFICFMKTMISFKHSLGGEKKVNFVNIFMYSKSSTGSEEIALRF